MLPQEQALVARFGRQVLRSARGQQRLQPRKRFKNYAQRQGNSPGRMWWEGSAPGPISQQYQVQNWPTIYVSRRPRRRPLPGVCAGQNWIRRSIPLLRENASELALIGQAGRRVRQKRGGENPRLRSYSTNFLFSHLPLAFAAGDCYNSKNNPAYDPPTAHPRKIDCFPDQRPQTMKKLLENPTGLTNAREQRANRGNPVNRSPFTLSRKEGVTS